MEYSRGGRGRGRRRGNWQGAEFPAHAAPSPHARPFTHFNPDAPAFAFHPLASPPGYHAPYGAPPPHFFPPQPVVPNTPFHHLPHASYVGPEQRQPQAHQSPSRGSRRGPRGSSRGQRPRPSPPSQLNTSPLGEALKEVGTLGDVRRESGAEDEDLRGRLERQLGENSLECVICCEIVGRRDTTWACRESCFAIFHLRCIQTWSRASESSAGGEGWRCPGCQWVTVSREFEYRCLCGQTGRPRGTRSELPHCCDRVCRRPVSKPGAGCTHTCALNCHPGPCPPCPRTAQRPCLCGKTKAAQRCGLSVPINCGQKCGKKLNCGKHECESECHDGACQPCQVTLNRNCHCGSSEKEVVCAGEGSEVFSCGSVCGQRLECGEHECGERCHSGDCPACPLAPGLLHYCPCGSKPLASLPGGVREKCSDPVPTCGKPCGKVFSCGDPSAPHKCESECHGGSCPPCGKTSSLQCLCGATKKEVPCADLQAFSESGLRCENKCKKRRRCGTHKCGEECCQLTEHPCLVVCGKALGCGLHRCQSLCHTGKCTPCTQASFEDLYCECGGTVTFAPVPCGTKPPVCNNACTRTHGCEHPVMHMCHPDPECPPCTYLVQKECMGKHEVRNNIACHIESISCGRTCGKELVCGHGCVRKCHGGLCVEEGVEAPCKQPCTRRRRECEHMCGLLCHAAGEDDACPASVCKAKMRVTCKCGRRSDVRRCDEVEKSWRNRLLLHAMNQTQPVNFEKEAAQEDKHQCLPCDEGCGRVARNRQVAEALGLGSTAQLEPSHVTMYTPFLQQQASTSLELIVGIEHSFMELVKYHKTGGKNDSRSHVFPPMSRAHRQLVHEYAEYWKMESHSYDPEPQRNVVVTARRVAAPPDTLLSTLSRRAVPAHRNPRPPPPPDLPSLERERLLSSTQPPT